MLQTIREATQGWIAGLIVSVIIVTFALWGIHSYFVAMPSDNIVQTVNGVDITKEQLNSAYERLRRQVQSQHGFSGTMQDEARLKSNALQSLTQIEVLKQASSAQGFNVYTKQIDAYLNSISEFQENGQFSSARFHEVLASSMLSVSDFLDIIKVTLEIAQPRLGVLFTSFSLPNETHYAIALVNQEREIAYLNLIPTAVALTKPMQVSAAQIRSYYDHHQDSFKTPPQVNVEYLELSLQALSQSIHPTDAALKSFYNEYINSFTQPLAWKLSDITVPLSSTPTQDEVSKAHVLINQAETRLKNGESFEKVAKDYTNTLKNTDWLTLNQVPAELQKAVAEINSPKQIKGPIKSSQGFTILKALDIRAPKIQSFESVKDKVKENYVRRQAEEQFASVKDQLADKTYQHPDSLQFAAKTLNLPIKTSELFTLDKGGNDISQYKKVRDVAFSDDVLKVQNNSDVIQLDPETVIVLRVKSNIPSSLLPLKDVTNQISDRLKAEMIETQLAKLAENLTQELKTGKDAELLAKQYQLTWSNVGFIGRFAKKVNPAILDKAFRMPNPALANMKPIYGLAKLPNGAYAIVMLKAVKDGVVNDKKQEEVFAEQVQNNTGMLEYMLYAQSEIKHAKIDKH